MAVETLREEVGVGGTLEEELKEPDLSRKMYLKNNTVANSRVMICKQDTYTITMQLVNSEV